MKNEVLAMVVTFVFAVAAGAPAGAAPEIDGRFESTEGYTNEYMVALNVEGLKKDDPLIPAPDPGTLWTYQDPSTGDVSAILIQPLTLVDNTYGANAIGWGPDAPSGKGHKFEDLVGSDKVELKFTNGVGAVVLHFVGDYISEIEKDVEYRTTGVTGKDGSVLAGDPSNVLEWGTSLDYNLNKLGHNTFLTDSPLTDDDYNDPPTAPGWIFEVIYEMKISHDAFDPSGFGDMEIVIVHDSPNKIGKNKVYTDITQLAPEPAGLSLIGLVLLALRKRRN